MSYVSTGALDLTTNPRPTPQKNPFSELKQAKEKKLREQKKRLAAPDLMETTEDQAPVSPMRKYLIGGVIVAGVVLFVVMKKRKK